MPKPIPLSPEILQSYVSEYFRRWRKLALAIYQQFGAVWIYDQQTLLARAKKFRETFTHYLPSSDFFYAMKCNNFPRISEALANNDWGLDVSSGEELLVALKTSAPKIVFSGPGKTPREHLLALKNHRRVTILLDSFGELARLQKLAKAQKKVIKVGVRITPPLKNSWRKFGIALTDLEKFFSAAEKCANVNLCGLQFHSSWNLTPNAQITAIRKIGAAIKKLPDKFAKKIEFFDIGGGFWIERGDWQTYYGATKKRVVKPLQHFYQPANSLDNFAQAISNAVKKNIFPYCQPHICFEPGRWLANDALHLIMAVVDVKTADLAITEVGTNVVGLDRYETDYAPILNLSRPSPDEKSCEIMGALCTPRDWWGYSYFGKSLTNGDILFIPDQGAYSYCLQQKFIKPLLDVVVIDEHF